MTQEQEKSLDSVRERMTPHCTQDEIEAVIHVTPLEHKLLRKYTTGIEDDAALLYSSVGIESVERFFNALLGIAKHGQAEAITRYGKFAEADNDKNN